jgi:hypothetical protein
LYFDDVLVQAAHLVNGLTIVQAEAVEQVEYFHVELDSHDILVAEGAPAESYVDCDNRLMFENGAEYARHHPGDERPHWLFCAHRLKRGDGALTAIRARLLDRAVAQGHLLTSDPGFHLIVDDAIVEPEAVKGGNVYQFVVPVGDRRVWLASRSVVPAEVMAGSQDVRYLGVPVERILLCGNDIDLDIAPDCISLHEGFHDSEGSHRWTNGHATLPPQFLACFPGDLTIKIQVGAAGLHYPMNDTREPQRSDDRADIERLAVRPLSV